MRSRIHGTSYWVSDEDRRQYGGRTYVLLREPKNPHDPNAVAVYGRGRKVGYVSAGRAAAIAPILDQIGADAYRVSGEGVSRNSLRLWVGVPKVDGLRRLASGRASAENPKG